MPRVSPDACCAYCGRSQDECGSLSYRHICRECGVRRAVSNAEQQAAKQGPLYERGVRGQLAKAQRQLAAA